jgi:hypothetical protein
MEMLTGVGIQNDWYFWNCHPRVLELKPHTEYSAIDPRQTRGEFIRNLQVFKHQAVITVCNRNKFNLSAPGQGTGTSICGVVCAGAISSANNERWHPVMGKGYNQVKILPKQN